MSFRASIPRLAAQPLASSSSSASASASSSSSAAAVRAFVNRAPPKHLRGKVKRAEAREAEYAIRVAEAQAKGLPIPRFKPLVVPENLQWYKVERSSGGELPVYTDVRADGGYKTILKRIQGDVASCQREINAYLENNHFDPISDPPKAVMKPITRQLVLKGNKKREVQEWLIQKGW